DGDLAERHAQGHVEVLAEGLVARRQGQPEAQLGAGGEPLGVGDGDLGPAEGPLPDAGHVAVAREAHLALLRVADPQARRRARGLAAIRRARAGRVAHRRAPVRSDERSTTGTLVTRSAVDRSWPVPWLPPAGGVVEATTCSIP